MQEEDSFDLGAALAAARSTLTIPEPARGQPALVMLCGLPGTGKTTLARELARRLPAVIVESDRIRHRLFVPPTYSPKESRRVHQVCHILMGWFLRHYYHVIYDATNLYEHHRGLVYRLARRSNARMVVVELTAREEVVRQRLAPRQGQEPSTRDPADHSDADWEVYLRMCRRAEPIQHEHLSLDTSGGDLEPGLKRVIGAATG